MRFKSGEFEGKTYEEVLLKHSDWAQWNIGKYPDGVVAKEMRRLMRAFDNKPFKEKCHGCGKPATRASTYRGSPSLMFWCDKCQPHSSGAERAKVQAVTSIREVLEHVDWTADSYRDWKRKIVRELGEAKGLPKRVSEKAALKFFEDS